MLGAVFVIFRVKYDEGTIFSTNPPASPKGSHNIVLKRVENYKPWKYNRFPNITYSRRMAEALEHYTSGPIRVNPKEPKHIELPWIIQAYAEVGKLPFRAIGALQGCNKSSGGGFVGAVNHAPEVAKVPPLTVQAGKNLSHIVSASDEDGDDLVFSLSNENDLPQGLTLDSETGQLDWTPTEDQVGFYQIVIIVSDGQEETYRTISIEVTKPEPTEIEDNNPKPPEGPCIKLQEGKVNEIKESVIICPGKYHAKLLIDGVSNIQIIGDGVVTDSIDVEDDEGLDGGINIRNSDNILIRGFELLYFGRAVNLINSHNNKISNIQVPDISCANGAYVDKDSSSNTITNITTYGPGAGVWIDGNENVVQDSHFEKEEAAYCDIITGPVVFGNKNKFERNTFLYHSLILEGSYGGADENEVNQNEILYPYYNGIVLIGADYNKIEANVIHYGGTGIGGCGDHNKITHNDLRYNDTPIKICDEGEDNVIYGNQEY